MVKFPKRGFEFESSKNQWHPKMYDVKVFECSVRERVEPL